MQSSRIASRPQAFHKVEPNTQRTEPHLYWLVMWLMCPAWLGRKLSSSLEHYGNGANIPEMTQTKSTNPGGAYFTIFWFKTHCLWAEDESWLHHSPNTECSLWYKTDESSSSPPWTLPGCEVTGTFCTMDDNWQWVPEPGKWQSQAPMKICNASPPPKAGGWRIRVEMGCGDFDEIFISLPSITPLGSIRHKTPFRWKENAHWNVNALKDS